MEFSLLLGKASLVLTTLALKFCPSADFDWKLYFYFAILRTCFCFPSGLLLIISKLMRSKSFYVSFENSVSSESHTLTLSGKACYFTEFF